MGMDVPSPKIYIRIRARNGRVCHNDNYLNEYIFFEKETVLGIMDGKRILVSGTRNKWSISWHSALSLQREGATLAFSVYSEREKGEVQKLLDTSEMSNSPIFLCDATKEESVNELYCQVGEHFEGKLDGLIHAIAFAKREDLSGQFVDTSRDGFLIAMDNSAYTLVALTSGAKSLFEKNGGGSVVTLSYLGGERVVPGYNMMGVAKAALESSMRYLANDLGPQNIRVNAVSAGPIKTLAASGISGFSSIFGYMAEHAPLRRNVDADEVGDVITFLLSPMARGITGEVIYVDAGYHIMGM